MLLGQSANVPAFFWWSYQPYAVNARNAPQTFVVLQTNNAANANRCVFFITANAVNGAAGNQLMLSQHFVILT